MKICISGPAMAGKTYFVNTINHQKIIIMHECARTVYNENPELVSDINKFRNTVFQRQIYIENEINQNNDICYIFDRGILDNLTFCKIFNAPEFKERVEYIKSIYKNNILKPYDKIYYFDLFPQITELIKKASQDKLRQSTIGIDTFKQHVLEFKTNFFNIATKLNMLDKISIITVLPEENSYNERNELVFKEIINGIS